MTNRACKVCGEFHDFFLAHGKLIGDQRYEYQCPETGQTAYLWDITDVEAIVAPPSGGVEIRSTGEPSARRGAVS